MTQVPVPADMRAILPVLGVALLLPLVAHGGEVASPAPQEAPPGAEEKEEAGDEHAPGDEASVAGGEEGDEVESDAMRDPVIAKVLRERVWIDRPRFTLETGGKIQVQYYNADSDDPENEDQWVLRRFRPFLMGRLATNWRWKFELELSSEITALDFDSTDLDVRDAYLRWVGFEREGRRLTLGNQKVPFSRDFMNPSTTQIFVERTFVGLTDAGVPDRVLGVHYRGPTRSDKFVLWGSFGTASHKQDVRGIRFESTVGASSDTNLGWLAVARFDVRPRGAPRIGDDAHFDLSLAAYQWVNDWSRNPFTDGGESLDPEKADLDRARGLEVSGRLSVSGFALNAQYNLIVGETMVDDFTGGIYVDGETDLEAWGVNIAYTIPAEWLELVGGVSRLDSDGYIEPWGETSLGFNLMRSGFLGRILGKLQLTHTWISSRFGIPDVDFQETRLQIQYVW